jgi:type III secretion protein F
MATWSGTPTNTLKYGDINDAILTNIDDGEGNLKAQIQKLGPNPSTMDTLVLQQGIQQWSMLCELQSTVVKTISETMKSIVRNA